MNLHADVIVVGAGSVGTMAAWQLAKRGYRVIAVDRSTIPGPFSAYAGESRLFRTIYREGSHYRGILSRAVSLWRELESESGTDLLRICGGVTIGRRGVPSFERLLESTQDQDYDFELLSGDAAAARLPMHRLDADSLALFDPQSGYLKSERAVLSAVQAAQRHGATFLEQREVHEVVRDGDAWTVRTGEETLTAPRVIVSTGTGARQFSRDLGARTEIRPQVLTWFPLRDPSAYAAAGEQTIFLRNEPDASFYGFPSSDGWTIKVAGSVYLPPVDRYDHPMAVHPEHIDTVTRYVRDYLPGVEPRAVRVSPCADAYTSDDTALLGEIDGLDGIIAAVGLSGHGFKMAPALGAAAADLATGVAVQEDIAFMHPNRFGASGGATDRLVLSAETL